MARDGAPLCRGDAGPHHRGDRGARHAAQAAADRAASVLRCALLGVVVIQGMLGMLTVTWNLKPLIVTLHLLFGLTTLAPAVVAVAVAARRQRLAGPPACAGPPLRRLEHRRAAPARAHRPLVLAVQIALGGWTSSNYAAVACPDFPTVPGQWWPQTDFRDAFVLWRGLGINYEGGVLDASGARRDPPDASASARWSRAWRCCWRRWRCCAAPALRTLGRRAGARAGRAGAAARHRHHHGAEGFPLPLATAHNAGAALLLLTALALYRQISRAAEDRDHARARAGHLAPLLRADQAARGRADRVHRDRRHVAGGAGAAAAATR